MDTSLGPEHIFVLLTLVTIGTEQYKIFYTLLVILCLSLS